MNYIGMVQILQDAMVWLFHFAALFVECLVVIYCVKVLQRMKEMGLQRTFMKPILIFGTIIIGARISEMLNEFTQIPLLTIIECIVLVVAFSILAFGIYDYNKMLRRN